MQTKNGEQTDMHVETNDNSVHVETSGETQNVETNMAEHSAWHVETPLVLHVAMTNNTPLPTMNAAVKSDTVSNVNLDTPAKKADENLPALTPLQQEICDQPAAKKDLK